MQLKHIKVDALAVSHHGAALMAVHPRPAQNTFANAKGLISRKRHPAQCHVLPVCRLKMNKPYAIGLNPESRSTAQNSTVAVSPVALR
jgi:hypothetical protein